MIYSCFDAPAGLYRYFEDGKQHAINADLPVPKFARDTGRVGVPSIEAARPFPGGAKPIGRGWHARGVVVQCPGSALGEASIGQGAGGVLLAAVVGFAGGASLARGGYRPDLPHEGVDERRVMGGLFGALVVGGAVYLYQQRTYG